MRARSQKQTKITVYPINLQKKPVLKALPSGA